MRLTHIDRVETTKVVFEAALAKQFVSGIKPPGPLYSLSRVMGWGRLSSMVTPSLFFAEPPAFIIRVTRTCIVYWS